MAKKRMYRQVKRRLLIFGAISFAIIIYFIFSISYYTINIYKLKKQELELNNKIDELKHNEKILNTEIEKLKDSEYIARFARENYSYSKDGEIIIKIDNPKNKEENKETDKFNYSNIIKIGSTFIILILLYVIFKNRKKKKKN